MASIGLLDLHIKTYIVLNYAVLYIIYQDLFSFVLCRSRARSLFYQIQYFLLKQSICIKKFIQSHVQISGLL